MFREIVTILFGIFTGWFAAFVGTTGGSAIVLYLFLVLGILPRQTLIAGTMLFVSVFPLTLVSLFQYNKKNIDFYIGAFMILGMIIGLYFGSKLVEWVNKRYGESLGDEWKFGLTAIIYAIMTFLYAYQFFSSKPPNVALNPRKHV